jgi:CBS-domain-containing membrane protein
MSHNDHSTSTRAAVCSVTFDTVLHMFQAEKKAVVSVPPSASIEQALATMKNHNILTLPITSRAFPSKYVYILSSFDILLYWVKFSKTLRVDSLSPAPSAVAEAWFDCTVESAMTMDAELEVI